jgi:hypothetical protein
MPVAWCHVRHQEQGLVVIPAQAGIQCRSLDSRLRGNDGTPKLRSDKALTLVFRFGIVPGTIFPRKEGLHVSNPT